MNKKIKDILLNIPIRKISTTCARLSSLMLYNSDIGADIKKITKDRMVHELLNEMINEMEDKIVEKKEPFEIRYELKMVALPEEEYMALLKFRSAIYKAVYENEYDELKNLILLMKKGL